MHRRAGLSSAPFVAPAILPHAVKCAPLRTKSPYYARRMPMWTKTTNFDRQPGRDRPTPADPIRRRARA